MATGYLLVLAVMLVSFGTFKLSVHRCRRVPLLDFAAKNMIIFNCIGYYENSSQNLTLLVR